MWRRSKDLVSRTFSIGDLGRPKYFLIVGGGPSFHRLRNTTGGIPETRSTIQLTSDDTPSAMKMSSADETHIALNDQRTGG